MGEGTGVFLALSRAPALWVSERVSILKGARYKAWGDCIRSSEGREKSGIQDAERRRRVSNGGELGDVKC